MIPIELYLESARREIRSIVISHEVKTHDAWWSIEPTSVKIQTDLQGSRAQARDNMLPVCHFIGTKKDGSQTTTVFF